MSRLYNTVGPSALVASERELESKLVYIDRRDNEGILRDAILPGACICRALL